ncbi:MAG TPA: head GIN domain-containing protein [Flavobacterium sp.]|jgi:hypothetical protein
MKKIFFCSFIILLLTGCGLSDDCIKSSGDVVSKEIEVPQDTNFEIIYVNAGIGMVLTQGDEYSVRIEGGDNFIDEIKAEISNNTLRLTDGSGCNWVRDYGNTVVYVTAPNVIEIYSNTEQTIRSNGVLTYPILRLYAMDFFGGVGTNDFYIEVDNYQLVVESNNVSAFYVTGRTGNMLLNFYDGVGRFEGPDFLAESIEIFHRGSNDMIIHPVDSLTGDIYSTGNVISKTHPEHIDVIEHYSGRLLFE